MGRQQTDIFISGGGVAGLTAAAAFGAAGFNVTIADPAPPITDQNHRGADLRTTAFLQPARRLLEQAGIWPMLAPYAAPLQIMRIADAAGQNINVADFDASDISDLPFGWNLPNWLLRREMTARLDALPNVTFLSGIGFDSLLSRSNYAVVRLTNGQQIEAKLVIGADGRHSPVRQAVGITTQVTRYGQKALTFAVTHDAPHDNISTEVHQSGGPFTLVPLPDHDGKPCSAVVWMDDGAATLARAELSQDAFNVTATERSANLYGRLALVGRRSVWPIISQIADTITAPRVALIAEAAHVLPPIGAQGLNMSLADIATLLDLCAANRDDPGAPYVLDQYARARHPDIKLRIAGINALNRASQTNNPMLQSLREKGIAMIVGAAPIRRRLMSLGLGAATSTDDQST